MKTSEALRHRRKHRNKRRLASRHSNEESPTREFSTGFKGLQNEQSCLHNIQGFSHSVLQRIGSRLSWLRRRHLRKSSRKRINRRWTVWSARFRRAARSCRDRRHRNESWTKGSKRKGRPGRERSKSCRSVLKVLLYFSSFLCWTENSKVRLRWGGREREHLSESCADVPASKLLDEGRKKDRGPRPKTRQDCSVLVSGFSCGRD